MTIVKSDAHGRICIRGIPKKRKFAVVEEADGWWVAPAPEMERPIGSRNRRKYNSPKKGGSLFDALAELGKLGLTIEPFEAGKKPAPPCRF